MVAFLDARDCRAGFDDDAGAFVAENLGRGLVGERPVAADDVFIGEADAGGCDADEAFGGCEQERDASRASASRAEVEAKLSTKSSAELSGRCERVNN